MSRSEFISQILLPILLNLASGVLLFVLGKTGEAIARKAARMHPRYVLILLAVAVALFLMGSLSVVWLSRRFDLAWYWTTILFLVPALALVYACTREPIRLWKSGIVGADPTIRGGIDYARSLELIESSFSYLGTGASKLTTAPAFHEAVKKCDAAGGKIRFLLSLPDSENLQNAAARAGRSHDDYRATVVASLRVLADLKERRRLAAEVRFYEGQSAFRIAILNERLALVSYNVYGDEPPDLFPQLHIYDREGSGVHSFYWAFERHFDLMWEAAKKWDFKEYLD